MKRKWWNIRWQQPQGKRGFAFIAALVGLTLMMITGTTFMSMAATHLDISMKALTNLHALAMADAGVNYAVWRQKFTTTGDANRDPNADVTPFTGISAPRSGLDVHLLVPGCSDTVTYDLVPITGGSDEALIWIYLYIPDSSHPDKYGYQVISRGLYRSLNRGIRAVFQGNTNATGSTGTTAEDSMFSGAFYSDSGFTLGGACNITGSAVVNGALSMSGGSSITGDLGVNGALNITGGSAVTVGGQIRARGNTLIDQGGNVTGGILTTGNLTINGGGTVNGGCYVNGTATLGGGAYNGGLNVLGDLIVNSGRNPTVTGAAVVNGSATFTGGGTYDSMYVTNNISVPSSNNLLIKSGTQVGGSVSIPNSSSATFSGGLTTLGGITVGNYSTPTVNGGFYSNGNVTAGGGTFYGTFLAGQSTSNTVALSKGAVISGAQVKTKGTLTNSTGKTVTKVTPAAGDFPVTVSIPTLAACNPTVTTGMTDIDFSKYVASSYSRTVTGDYSITKATSITDSGVKVTGNMTVNGGALTAASPVNYYVGGNLTIGSGGGTSWTAGDTMIYVHGNVTIQNGVFRGSGKFIIVAEGTISCGGSYDYGSTKFVLLSHTGVSINNNGSLYADVYCHNSSKTGMFTNTGTVTGAVITDGYNASGSGTLKCTYATAPYPFLNPGSGGGGLGANDWQVASWEIL